MSEAAATLAAVCVVCGYPVVHAKSRCRSCWRYQHTHDGRDRTEDMIVKAERRRMEMQEYRRVLRRAAGLS